MFTEQFYEIQLPELIIPDGLQEPWQELESHRQKIGSLTLRELFAENPNRTDNLTVKFGDWELFFANQLITDETIPLLFNLARSAGVETERDKMFGGERINTTENRAVLHTALRNPRDTHVFVDGKDVMPEVHNVLDRMVKFSDEIRTGERKGHTGKPIKNIVNIGIGGSDLGPVMAYEALKPYKNPDLTFRFVSNVDGADFAEKTADLDPEETLFIIASKTFTTEETMTNAGVAREWTISKLKDESAISKHFVALSTNKEEVEKFGIDPSNMFEFWDFVGGRYSLPSAIGLSLMISIGKENFQSMLEGFHDMDVHFKDTPLERNMPIIMALLSIWNINFLDNRTHAILPYAQILHRFPAYLQQLIMESNGKSVTKDGKKIKYQTAPVVWGEAGTNGQHSFYQLLHQGTQIVPADFIAIADSHYGNNDQLQKLNSNVIAQPDSLANGETYGQVLSRGVSESLAPHKIFDGNRPSSTLLAKSLTPKTLGQLIALYEHITFVQGVIWGINSFDQFGVELGKASGKKAREILEDEDKIEDPNSFIGMLSSRIRKLQAESE